MIPPEELRHLADGPRLREVAGGVGLVEVHVSTSGDANDLLRRSREVLRAILAATSEGWPAETAWRERLPHWFVEACAVEESAEDAARWLAWWRALDDKARARAARERPWSLADWLHWLHPDERQWYWWDGSVVGQHAARIIVEVAGWPAPLGALQWLLNAAGADAIEVVEALFR